MLTAVVPLKSMELAKGRLSGVLDPARRGALARRESRGAHWRADHPGQGEPRHTEITLAQALAAADAVRDVPRADERRVPAVTLQEAR